jgi:hypothetical protein
MTPREIQNEIKFSINEPPFTHLVSLPAGRKDTRVPMALNQSPLPPKLQPLPTTPTPRLGTLEPDLFADQRLKRHQSLRPGL